MKAQQGFTLIELMIVVAIIAILAAIAISQYQDYVIRSQVSEASALTDGVKTAVAEFYQEHGRFPPTNTSAFLSLSTSIKGQYVSEIDVTSGGALGFIGAAMGGSKANAKIPASSILIFSAITNGGTIEWHCKSTTIKKKWMASSCDFR